MAETFDPGPVARELAAAHPDAMLPCPACAADVKAANLPRHLEKVHADAAIEGQRWAGSDRAILRPLFGLFGAALLMIPLLVVVPATTADLVLGVVMGLVTLFLVGAALTLFGVLPAELVLQPDRLTVRYAFGLLTRSVALPPERVEVGTLVEARPRTHVPGHPDWASDDVRAGTYLRLRDARGAFVTIGAKKGTGLRAHWDPAGWADGGRIRHWHIMLAPTALVAVEYCLAQSGRLAPRS